LTGRLQRLAVRATPGDDAKAAERPGEQRVGR
jgi:hypothetical protein